MNSIKKARETLSEQEIDRIVEAQGNGDSAWERPIRVVRATPASLSIPAELAARAAFLARLHKEENLERWLTRIIKERVELEEVAFTEAKRELSLRSGT
jgi:hypothetical protein